MKSLMSYTHPIKKEDLNYLSKLTVGVVGSRMLAEIMWRIGVGCVKYVGDFISTSDVFTDVTRCIDEIGTCDVLQSKDNTLIIPYLLENLKTEELVKMLRGCDVVISHRYVTLCAEVAEKFGVPFMPPIVTTILPDELNEYKEVFEKLESQRFNQRFNPITYSLLCSAQASEFIKLCTSGDAVLAPNAYIPISEAPYFKRINIKDFKL